MEEIEYVGEHLLPGNIGRFLVVLSIVSALISTVAYLLSTFSKDLSEEQHWRNWGRIFFTIHGASVIGIVGILFMLIFNHRYEYYYVWQHSSNELPLKYMLSCFWEGQEGSFLLWSFWHAILGWVLMATAKKWESPVLAVIGITQVFLLAMILGLHIFDYKIGVNPFTLIRHAMQAPIFSNPNYVNMIEDGSGLNPLLQNYWMTIHPPTLFLGFASTIVPFAFALASLMKRDYTGWVNTALPWTLFSTVILGIGILMGGAWAYESLSFGGFWAWDPVENASLVPWLTLVAGLHTLVAYKSTKHGLTATYILLMSTFILILYSTFLTRSGILGDTSVHAFTDLGMSGQLVFFLAFYCILSLGLLIWNYKSIPTPEAEEKTSSREFWMFVGALVFSVSAIQISFTTSIPVFNSIFSVLADAPVIGSLFTDLEWAPPTQVVEYYNNIQVWVAVMLGFLTAVVQYFNYKKTNWQKFAVSIAGSALVSAVLTVAITFGLEIDAIQYVIMLFASIFTVVSNFTYMLKVVKKNWRFWGGSISHVGFGLMLIGILIANFKQEVISLNTTVDFGDAFDEQSRKENILLRLDESVDMYGYKVTYVGDTVIGPDNFYFVDYYKVSDEGDTSEYFRLLPNAQLNPEMGIVSNPDTRHYWTRDIYTHVTSVPDRDALEEEPDTFVQHKILMGDTFFISKAFVVLEGLNPSPTYENPQEGDIAIGVKLSMKKPVGGDVYTAEPVFVVRNNQFVFESYEVPELGVNFRVEQILPDTDEFVIGVSEKTVPNNFIIMKAIMFPYINVLWIGWLVTIVGFVISIVKRVSDNKRGGA